MRQDVGHAAEQSLLGFERDIAHKVRIEDLLAEREDALGLGAAGGEALIDAVGRAVRLHGDGERDGEAVIADQLADAVLLEILLGALLRAYDDARADLGLLLQGERVDGVGAVRLAAEDPRLIGLLDGAGVDADLVRDHEAREQADAEAADVVLIDAPRLEVALGALSDDGEEPMDLGVREAGAGIREGELLAGDEADGDGAVPVLRLMLAALADGVDGVLEQLAQEDLRAAVKVIGEDVDHPA